MNDPIRVKDCQAYTVLLSEIPNMEFLSCHRFIKDENQAKAIITALVADILTTRKDREVEFEVWFSNNYFEVTLNFGYSHLRKETVLQFQNEYPFNIYENMDKILSDSIEHAMKEYYAHFKEVDYESSLKFFKNVKVIDEVLNFNGSLVNYCKTTTFKPNVYEIKDTFNDYKVTKTCNGSPCINLESDNFKISIYHEGVNFRMDGIEMNFKPEQMGKNVNVTSLIKNMFEIAK